MTQLLGVPEITPSRLVAREIRAELGRQQLSQRRLALKMGTTYQWVNRRISTGETDLTLEDVQRIAQALQVPIRNLVAGWTLPRLDSNQEPAGNRLGSVIPVLTGHGNQRPTLTRAAA